MPAKVECFEGGKGVGGQQKKIVLIRKPNSLGRIEGRKVAVKLYSRKNTYYGKKRV